MPTECAHATCRNLKVKGNGISFHHFPKNPDRRKRWACLMGRPEGWEPSQWDLVCGAHFREEDFDKTGQTIRLREGVEPSVYVKSSHPKKRLKSQNTGKSRKKLCCCSPDSKSEQHSGGLTSSNVKAPETTESDKQLQPTSSKLELEKQESLILISVKPQAKNKCNNQDTAVSGEHVLSNSESKQQSVNLVSAKPQVRNKLKIQMTVNICELFCLASPDSTKEEEHVNLTLLKQQTFNKYNNEETADCSKQLQHDSSDSENEQQSINITPAKLQTPNNLKLPESTDTCKQLCHVSPSSKNEQYFLKLPPDKPQIPKFHTYSVETEKSFKSKWLRAERRVEELERQLHNSMKREKRRKTLLAGLTEELKDKNLLIDKLQAKLDLFGDFPIELFVAKSAYTEEQKEFAVTLHHYGPKAYEYLQKKLKLPATRTVRRWLSDKDGSPPVHSSVIDALKAKIQQNKSH